MRNTTPYPGQGKESRMEKQTERHEHEWQQIFTQSKKAKYVHLKRICIHCGEIETIA